MKTSKLDVILRARRHVLLGVLTIFVLLGGFAFWSIGSSIAGAVVATGKVEVEQSRQIIQHPDGGVVSEILVKEGDNVEAGEILIRLDGSRLRSELNIIEAQLFETRARRARLEAERDGASSVEFSPDLVQEAEGKTESMEQMDGQVRLFAARAETLARTIEQLNKRQDQIDAQISGIVAQSESLREQFGFIDEELSAQQQLLNKGLTQSQKVLDLLTAQSRVSGQLAELSAAKAQSEGRITEIDIQILALQSQRREEASAELRDIGSSELELVQRKNVVVEQISRLEIRSPAKGTVLGLRINTPRSVVRPADAIAYVVPVDRPLIITVQIAPMDIDEIYMEQDVRLVFPTFSAKMVPELGGRITMISADAFTDSASNATYYRAEISLPNEEAAKLGQTLLPGMPVQAFISTETRSPLSYLIKPFLEYFSLAFRES